ncbi:hypothetical protein ACFX2I_001049 [Malus domestica]
MASSLVSIPFLGAPTTNALSGLRTTSSSVQFVMRPRTAKKLQVQAAGNITGNHFRVTTFGEAHGGGVGCVIDGCPPRLPLSEKDLQGDLDRRRPGQSPITTLRKETDTCRILSGVHEGVTTGTPILVLVPNTDQKGRVYDEMSVAYRPSHADRTYDQKYGIRSVQGGGRSSARETIGRVAAGALAKKILKAFSGTEVLAYVSQVQKVVLPEELVDHHTLTLDQAFDLGSSCLHGSMNTNGSLFRLVHLQSEFTMVNSVDYPLTIATKGTQLTSLNITSYEGSPGLCGDPLPKKCGNPKAPQLPPSTVDEGDSSLAGIFEFDWKIVSAGCGSGLVVGVVLADAVITRRPDLFLKIVGTIRQMIRKI